jgi:serine protease Do
MLTRSNNSHGGRPRRFRLALVGMASAVALTAGGSGIVALAAPDPVAETIPQNADRYATSYADLVERVLPAVVNVSVEKSAPVMAGQSDPRTDPEMQRFFERFFGQPLPMPDVPEERRQQGEGSGFIIGPDGWIVTNAHVVGGADSIEVVLHDGSTKPAELHGIDAKTDLALIKVEAEEELPYVRWGDSSEVRVGDKVLAVGNPFGLGGTVTSGIISATGREIGAGPYDDFLQVDAAINRGNSGGPTFNLEGEVVGVNSIIFSPSGGNVGIGFAISANLAKDVIEELRTDGEVERGWLGVGIQEMDEDLARGLGLDEPRGALVTQIEPDSPAAGTELEPGDVIVGFAGQPIERVRELTRAVADMDPGSEAEMVVWSDGKERQLTVELGQMPTEEVEVAEATEESPNQPKLGLALANLTPQVKSQLGLPAETEGVLVQDVEPGGPADEKGLRAGDIILRVGEEEVSSADQVVEAVSEAHDAGKDSVVILYQRQDQQLFTAVPLALS